MKQQEKGSKFIGDVSGCFSDHLLRLSYQLKNLFQGNFVLQRHHPKYFGRRGPPCSTPQANLHGLCMLALHPLPTTLIGASEAYHNKFCHNDVCRSCTVVLSWNASMHQRIRTMSSRGQTQGDKRQSAIFCGFLRFSAVSCENLRFPDASFSKKRRQSAKMCENQRTSAFGLGLSP